MNEAVSDDLNMASARAPMLYQPSGRVPVTSLVAAAAVLIPLALVLGFLYSAAMVYLPYVKLRGLVTFFSGAGLGFIAGTLCYRLKYRSRLFAFLTILGFTSIAYYTCWAVHPGLVGLKFDGLAMPDFIAIVLAGFDPLFIAKWIGMLYDDGLWNMGGGKMKGLWLVAIWLIEFGMIFGTSIAGGMKTYGKKPFCEICNSWNDETEDLAVLPVSTDDPAWTRVRNGDFDALKKLQIVPDQQATYVELRLADCPTCDQSDYLSAIGITLTVDEGEIKKNESDIFRHLTVTRTQREEIVAFAEAMAEAVREMSEADDEFDEQEASEEATTDDVNPYEPPGETGETGRG
ncbi:MAG: hypothetical protein AAFX06_11295 [Planctomycetota bacterium]